tara:strand:+ start:635 stop:832 length:198 start_codon:yes stop_codon:yes gene_type:complete
MKITLVVLAQSAYGQQFRSDCEDSRDVKFCSDEKINDAKGMDIDNIIYIGNITYDRRKQFQQLID